MSAENTTLPAPCIHLHPNLISIWDIADGICQEPSYLIEDIHHMIEQGDIPRDNVAIASNPTRLGLVKTSCPVYYLNFAAAMYVALHYDQGMVLLLRYLDAEHLFPDIFGNSDEHPPYTFTRPEVEPVFDSLQYTSSELGVPLGLSSRQVNLQLEVGGIQKKVVASSSDTSDPQATNGDAAAATEEVDIELTPPLVGFGEGKFGEGGFGGKKLTPTEENVE